MATGKAQSIQITASSGLSQDEIDRLVKEAEANVDSDRRKRSLIDARNAADALVYTAEKSLVELGDKIDEGSRSQVSSAVAQLKAAMGGEDVAEIQRLTEELNRIAQAMSTTAYQSAGAAPGSAHNGEAGASDRPSNDDDDDIVDAEFQEVA